MESRKIKNNSILAKFTVGLIILVVVAVGFSIYLTLTNPANTTTSTTSFSFSPQTIDVKDGEIVEIDIIFNSTKPVYAVDLSLKYDLNSFELISITPGNYYENPIIFSNSNGSGNIFFASGSLTPTAGSGILARVSLKSLLERKSTTPLIMETNPVVSIQEIPEK